MGGAGRRTKFINGQGFALCLGIVHVAAQHGVGGAHLDTLPMVYH